jgi:hypothetical protein
MGYFVVKHTIPPNTLRSMPVVVTIDVENRILKHREIQFPMNAAMLVGFQLCDHSGRIWPSQGSPSEWITGDNNTVSSSEQISLSGPPFELVVRLYNEDNTFERTPEARFEVIPGKQ